MYHTVTCVNVIRFLKQNISRGNILQNELKIFATFPSKFSYNILYDASLHLNNEQQKYKTGQITRDKHFWSNIKVIRIEIFKSTIQGCQVNDIPALSGGQMGGNFEVIPNFYFTFGFSKKVRLLDLLFTLFVSQIGS